MKNKKYRKWIEPFAGSASFSIAAMELGLADEYIINDSDSILINTHRLMRDKPDQLKVIYSDTLKKYNKAISKKDFFINIIDEYNQSDNEHKSLLLPFIINHSWSGIISHDQGNNIIYRENKIDGKIIPGYLDEANLSLNEYLKEIDRVSHLFLTNNVSFKNGDFVQVLDHIQPGDFVAFNPPYPENERTPDGKVGMYTELYSHDILFSKLIKIIQFMDMHQIDYFMTYGFYNPSKSKFVLLDHLNKPRNYFRVLGYKDCAFGIALDQMYFSQNFSIPHQLNAKIFHANDILDNQTLLPEEALEKFMNLSKGG